MSTSTSSSEREFALAFDGEASTGWEHQTSDGFWLRIQRDNLGINRKPWSWMIVKPDGYLGSSGLARTRVDAESAVLSAWAWS